MALRIPPAVETHGDAKRLAQGVGAFIVELHTDPRVLPYRADWSIAHYPADREFELLLAEYPETIERYIDEIRWRDHVALRPFVETLLHRLPPSWVDMTTSELLRAFRTAHYHGRTRADVRPATRPATLPQFGVAVELPPDCPRGRVPPDPFKIQRGMRQLVRRYVLEQPASKRALAREFIATRPKRDPAEGLRDVTASIRQAWGLLDLAAGASWSPTKPGHIVIP